MPYEGPTIIRFRPLGVKVEPQGCIAEALRNQDGSKMPHAKSGSSTDEKKHVAEKAKLLLSLRLSIHYELSPGIQKYKKQ